jgi:DNA invertase Pin-like site-specific DNA recombinase
MSCIIGYIRPYLDKKSVKEQLDRLKTAGATRIFQELNTSAGRDWPHLDKLMKEARDGDTVVVDSLGCLAHNTRHLLEIVESLNAAGVSLKVIDSGLDTSSPHGEVLSLLLGVIVDFERQKLRESQAAGIARARREGRYKGRKPTAMAKTDEVLELDAQGLIRQKIADQLGIGVASVYRILKNHATSHKARSQVRQKPAAKPKRVKRKPTREPPAEQLLLF